MVGLSDLRSLSKAGSNNISEDSIHREEGRDVHDDIKKMDPSGRKKQKGEWGEREEN